MPRPREFDAGEVLDRATRLFWERGFAGTSLHDLEAVMGIGRTSIYAAFGDKEELFLKVVDHYDATYSAQLREALSGGQTVLEAVRDYFDGLLAAFENPDLPTGCLVTNVAVEGDRATTRLGRKIAASIARTEDAFYHLLREGQATGEVDLSVDIRALSRYLVAATHGLSVLAKALPNTPALRDIVAVILSNLETMNSGGVPQAPVMPQRTEQLV